MEFNQVARWVCICVFVGLGACVGSMWLCPLTGAGVGEVSVHGGGYGSSVAGTSRHVCESVCTGLLSMCLHVCDSCIWVGGSVFVTGTDVWLCVRMCVCVWAGEMS